MNREQYKTWQADFARRFPDAHNWVQEHPDVGMLWYEEILGHLDMNDCLQANRAIFQGQKPRWDDFRRETIGATVAAAARAIGHERRERDAKREMAQSDARRRKDYERPALLEEMHSGQGEMAKAYRLCLQWIREGVSKTDRLKRLEDILS